MAIRFIVLSTMMLDGAALLASDGFFSRSEASMRICSC
jgi:hypothetical protein